MCDTISYTCTLPLKPLYREPGAVPHQFVRSDHARRDGSQSNRCEATITSHKIGLTLSVRNGAVFKVQCELPKLLYGHNGRLMAGQPQFALAFDRLEHVLGLLCDPLPDLGGFVPGRPVHEEVQFTRVDFPWQFPDPDLRIANLLRHAVHPDIRRNNRLYPTGASIPGTNLTVNAYDKAAQLGVPVAERYTRVEVQMKGDKLRRLFNGDKDAPLTAFTFADVYRVYRDVLLLLDGPAMAVAVGGGKASLAQTLAQMHLAAPHADVLGIYLGMRVTNNRSARRLRRDFTAALQEAGDPVFAELLPEGSPPPAYDVVDAGKEARFHDQFVVEFGWPSDRDPLAHLVVSV